MTKMTSQNHSVPKWVMIYLWLTFILTLGASTTGYFAPKMLLAGWPVLEAEGALSLAGPLGLFLARNVATAAVTLIGLLNKHVQSIRIVLILRAVSDGFDFINNLIAGNSSVAIMGLVMCIIEIYALSRLRGIES